MNMLSTVLFSIIDHSNTTWNTSSKYTKTNTQNKFLASHDASNLMFAAMRLSKAGFNALHWIFVITSELGARSFLINCFELALNYLTSRNGRKTLSETKKESWWSTPMFYSLSRRPFCTRLALNQRKLYKLISQQKGKYLSEPIWTLNSTRKINWSW